MKPPAYVYPQTSVSRCAKEMVKHDIDQIPVLDANNRLIGMITGKNLIKVLIK